MVHLPKLPNKQLVPHVVIIGGGFAGMDAAKKLANKDVKVTLVDRNNHHIFQPLLYQVAMAGLSPADIAVPIRSALRQYDNIEVVMGEVTQIDVRTQHIVIDDATLAYDYLIVAAGATHSYFGHEDWAPLAPGLKSLEDATEIRRRVLLSFERAERHPEKIFTDGTLNFVVIGGGPTGVELAGTLAELSRYTLSRDFRHIHSEDARIILIEAGSRLLTAFPESLAKRAARTLIDLNVTVLVDSPVTEITPHFIVAGGEKILSETVIWAAGVKAASIANTLRAPLDKAGRVVVNDDLSIPDAPNVFVAGDLACVKQGSGKPVPGVAPAAMQEGKHAAENILRLVAKKQTRKFVYFDKGNLATVGRASAIADFGKIKLSGFIAWLLWIFIHIFFLISFRNRVIVLFEWALAYYTYQRGARLITKDIWAGRFQKPEKINTNT